MMAWPHFLHGSEASGARSPGIKVFASQPGHVTIFKGRFTSLIGDFNLPLTQRFQGKSLLLQENRVSFGRRNEKHVRKINNDARVGQWLDGHLPALFPSIGRRGSEILKLRFLTLNPRLPKRSRVFCFNHQTTEQIS
jgi:hypothetical protein